MGFYKKSNDANSERGLGGNNMDNQTEINIIPSIQIPRFSSNQDGKPRTNKINNITVLVGDKIREFMNSINNSRKGIVSKDMFNKMTNTPFLEVFSKLGTLSAKSINIPELKEYVVKPEEMKESLAEILKKQEENLKKLIADFKQLLQQKEKKIEKLNGRIEKLNGQIETIKNKKIDLELMNELKNLGEMVREKDIEIENLIAKLENREPVYNNITDINQFANDYQNILLSNAGHVAEIIKTKNDDINFLNTIVNEKAYKTEEDSTSKTR